MAKHLSLSSHTGSGMVIQQQLPYYLAGRFRPAAKVSLSLERFPLDEKNMSPLDNSYGIIFEQEALCDDTGEFRIELPAIEASFDSFKITVNAGKESIVVDDVLIGEVWVAAGHSGFTASLDSGLDEAVINEQANMHFLRFFLQSSDGLRSRREHYEYRPRDYVADGKWCSGNDPDSVGRVSAISWYYARYLQQELQIPVAVIETAMRSSFIHSWMSRESIDSHEHIRQRIENYGCYRDENTWQLAGDWGCNLPAALFNHKIAPLRDIGIRGVIWHQGEKDYQYPDYYLSAMKYLIEDWQNIFRIPADKPRSLVPGTDLADAPITGEEHDGNCAWLLIQQLPAACAEDRDGLAFAYYTEALSRLTHQINGPLAVLPTYNLYRENRRSKRQWFNSDFKIDVKNAGFSLKQIAIGLLYHRKASSSAPECDGIEMVGNKLLLSFSNTAEGLKLADGVSRLSGFTICGDDRIFHQAQARILYGVRVLVWHEQIHKPQAVSYAFASLNQEANLVNSENIAVVPFRSDRQPAKYILPYEWNHCDRLDLWAMTERAGSSERRECLLTDKLPLWEITDGKATISLEEANKQEGDASLLIQYKKTENETAFKLEPCLNYGSFFPPMDISEYAEISLEVFNPDRHMKKIHLEIEIAAQIDDNNQMEIEQISSKPQLVISALRWQSFRFDLGRKEGEDYNLRAIRRLKICLDDNRDGGSIYLDNIRFLANLTNNV